ncbi:MAG: efflux RND transporter permease subunit [Polyangiaceae bacterium]
MSIFERARSRTSALVLLIAVLAVTGAYEATQLPSAIFPSVTFPLVKVIADVGQERAARMMPTTTRPLEEAVLRVPGVVRVLSTTSRGSTEISAEFAWGTNMDVALQRVHGEMQRIQPDLPPNVKIDVEWMSPAKFPIQGYALTSDTRSEAELRELAEFVLLPAIVRLPGVAQVQIQGGRKREFEVRLHRDALEGRHLSARDVIDALRRDDQVLSAGLTEKNHELYLALVDGRVHDIGALASIAVPVRGGVPARLSDLGEITTADEVSYVRTTAGGHPAVLLNVLRQPSASTVAIATAIDSLIRAKPSVVPADVHWSNFYDQAEFVSGSVAGVRDAILIGVALAGLVLFAFLRSVRMTVIAVAAIPVTIAVVSLGLAAFGQTINLMTLAGVAAALGLIADDAIVVIENIQTYEERGDDDPVARGVAEILPALAASSLSTVIIFLPFMLLSGVVGAFFRPLALTMALTLVVSFTLGWLLVPLFSVGKARKRSPGGRHPWREGLGRLIVTLGRGYDHVVGLFLRRGWVAAVATTLLIGGAYAAYRSIGTDFLPQMDEGSIILDYWTPPGTSLTDTNAMLNHVDAIVAATPDVAAYSRRTGTQLGFFITEANRGDYAIRLKPRGTRGPVDAVVGELRERISSTEPAIHIDFGQLLEDNIGDLTGGTPQPIDVKVFGEDPESLASAAKRAAAILASVPGTKDVFDGIVIAGPALDIRADPEAIARYGLTTEDLHASLEPAITGTVVDQVRVGARLYDLRVLVSAPQDLAEIAIHAPSGALVHLRDVASIRTGPPEAEIDRENLKTYVGVTGRLSGRSLGGAMTEARARLGRDLHLGPGESIAYGGMYEQQQASFRGLMYVLVAGLVLVAIVILFQFGDWRAPVVTAALSLATLAGVLGALLVTGQTLNISSFVAAIMMVGIVGENAIFVIHVARLELLAGATPDEAWARASRKRLRAVAMTTLATALALAPLAMAIGHGSQLMQPLAIGIIGGFVISGGAVLFLLPGLYRMLDPHGRLGAAVAKKGDER